MATAHPDLPEFTQFIDTLKARCEAGARTYGDNSFNKPLPQGLQEIMDELVDQAGWAWCQWVRLYRIQQDCIRSMARTKPGCIMCASDQANYCANERDGWLCTRQAKHAGVHAVCIPEWYEHRVAMWTDEDPTVALALPTEIPFKR